MENASATTPSADLPEAHIELDLAADFDDVWHALTSDDGLAPWMGEGASIDEPDDLRFPDPVTGRPRRGIIDNIDPNGRLAFSWWPEDDPELITHVAIALQPIDTGTRISVTETLPAADRALRATASMSASASWAWRCAALSVSHLAVYA